MNLPFIVWTHDGKAPEILARAAQLAEARTLWSNSKHAAISSGGVLADVRNTTGDTQARAMERAAEDAWRTQGATPAPAAAPTVPARPSRPAATRPPMPRRRTSASTTATPALAKGAPETPLKKDPIQGVSGAVGALQTPTPAAPPSFSPESHVEAALRHRVEQLRGEVEGLTTDLGVARAETATVLRQAGELSRQLGAAREELEALRATPVAAVPAPVLLDELMLERIAQRAARRAVALQGDAAKLDRLCREHGGADAVARIVEGALALRKAVG